MTRCLIILLVILTTVSCQKTSEPQTIQPWDSTKFHVDWKSITAQLVSRMKLQRDERVLVIAQPGRFEPLIPLLSEWVNRAGGEFLGAISVDSTKQPGDWTTSFVGEAEGNSFPALVERFKTVDLCIMFPGASATDIPYAAMQEVLRGENGRTIHFHWSGAYTLSGVPLDITTEIDRCYQNAILGTDYSQLSGLQEHFERAARQQDIRITTPSGTDLSFRIGDRPVTRQDGDASRIRSESARNLIDREIEIPAGAIRVAPMEESVHGKIAFPDSQWNGEIVKGLVVTLVKGKIVNMSAKSGLKFVKTELDAAGKAGYSFREFALGFNPLLTIPEIGPRWIPYYGYGAGIVRLSLGDNTELGGTVSGGYVRWNFFTDATVMVGQTTLVRDGKMLR
jgi:hypothetical protein